MTIPYPCMFAALGVLYIGLLVLILATLLEIHTELKKLNRRVDFTGEDRSR